MTPLLVMVAPNGARRTKADHPHLPITPAEIAAEAVRCRDAGATVFHLHVRDQNDAHSLDPDRYRAAIDAVHAAVGDSLVIQVTTEAVGRYDPAEQMAVIRELRPEAVSLALRELIPSGVITDDAATADAAAFLRWLQRERIAPQYILYAPDDIRRYQALRQQGVIPQERAFAMLVLGRYTEPAAVAPRDLLPYLDAYDGDDPWALCAFGPSESACMLTAAALGGHVRVGFENNLWLADGSVAANNAALVEQVVAGAKLLGRPLADIETTRALLAETAV